MSGEPWLHDAVLHATLKAMLHKRGTNLIVKSHWSEKSKRRIVDVMEKPEARVRIRFAFRRGGKGILRS